MPEERTKFEFVCVGSVHWDSVGRISAKLRKGDDVPGEVLQIPGGVALNVSLALNSLGAPPLVCSAVGDDREGEELLARVSSAGLTVRCIYKVPSAHTDRCVFIEDEMNQVTGVSDCRMLENESVCLVHSLTNIDIIDWIPSPTLVADGNLSIDALNELANKPTFKSFQINFMAASPRKAARAMAFSRRQNCTVYLNKKEAEELGSRCFKNSRAAAQFMLELGFSRVIVTDSGRAVVDCDRTSLVTATPGKIPAGMHVLGAGDNFTAAHMTAEKRGFNRSDALDFAIEYAQQFTTKRSRQ